MKVRQLISKRAVGCLLLVSSMTLTGCQQNAGESSDVDNSGTETQVKPQSETLDKTVENERTAQPEGQAVSSIDDHVKHELQGRDSGQGPDVGQGQGMGRGRGMGRGVGRGMGRGPGAMGGMREDMSTLHAMFAERNKIKRTVKKLPNGAEATTESDVETIARLLQEHVPAMESRVIEDKPLPPMTFHPIFVELIKHADDYTLEYEETDKGMKVTYHAEDPFVIMLVQEHAQLVSRFLKNGMEEIHKPYALPETSGQREVPTDTTAGETNKTDLEN